MGILTADALSRVLGASNEEALTALKAAADNGWDLLSALYGGKAVRFRPGRWGLCTDTVTAASNTLGNNTLRLSPWIVPRPVTIDRIGTEVLATVGEAGSIVKLGVYADLVDGYGGYPGLLVADFFARDAVSIDGTSATVQSLTIAPLRILPGLYWVGGAVQGAPTTQPNVRVVTGSSLVVGNDVAPIAAGAFAGYNQTSVSGALPASFAAAQSIAGVAPRIHFRVAA